MYGEYKDLADKIETNAAEKQQLDQETASLKVQFNKTKGNFNTMRTAFIMNPLCGFDLNLSKL